MSLPATTTPQGISGACRGISHTLDGFIVQTENIDDAPVTQQVADQNGAIAYEVEYDRRYDLSLSVISKTTNASTNPPWEGDTLRYGGHTWFIDKVAEVGTYNDLRKWNITAHRYTFFPNQTTSTQQ